MFIEFNDKEWNNIIAESTTNEELLDEVKNSSRYSSNIKINYEKFNQNDLDTFYAIAKERGDRSVMMQISGLLNILNKKTIKMSSLKLFAVAIDTYIKEKAQNNWIFIQAQREDIYLPYLVTEVTYIDANPSREVEASTHINLAYNSCSNNSKTLYFDLSDIKGKTIEEILLSYKILLPTQDLLDDYSTSEEKYLKELKNYKKQYKASGFITEIGGDDEKSYYRFNDSYETKQPQRIINVEEQYPRKFKFYLTKEKDTNSEDESKQQVVKYKIPIHPYLRFFNLDTHSFNQIHVTNIEDYIYNETLRDKLVLPESHSDLLNILTGELSALKGDIIEGKSMGVTILCSGEPGLGKTLSAECYAEIVKKSLYKVNSGQLGTKPEEVETNLTKILKRADTWGTVLLLDEADTYIRQRRDNIEQNAIVASFLRTLEYFNGLLFMTTNRVNDVDDAILSRCIAHIKYDYPNKQEQTRIWKILSEEMGHPLDDTLLNELSEEFKNTKISGRDIKGLLHLAIRFSQSDNQPLNINHFRKATQFRGL